MKNMTIVCLTETLFPTIDPTYAIVATCVESEINDAEQIETLQSRLAHALADCAKEAYAHGLDKEIESIVAERAERLKQGRKLAHEIHRCRMLTREKREEDSFCRSYFKPSEPVKEIVKIVQDVLNNEFKEEKWGALLYIGSQTYLLGDIELAKTAQLHLITNLIDAIVR